ncbi:MAG: class I SAM-dependent methyltransferase [Geothrix sp.]|nr:class I SAM-dependent methyltransferase [Geothrix sp.]
MTDTERFDRAAPTWDHEDRRVALAQAVAEAISARVPLSRGLSTLDFGCGTGLVTLALAPKVGAITGADTSPGMLKTLAEKAQALGIPVRLRPLDPAGTGDLGGPYQLIVSSMTLHHIPDVPALFHRFAGQLQPGGHIALADLDQEDGSFHEDLTGVHHHGFSRDQIQAWLEAAGFLQIHLETAQVSRKNGKDYPVFLATARKA